MGWFFLIIIALLVMALLWRFGSLRGSTLAALTAAMVAGGIGYAWQGRPNLRGKPTPPPVEQRQPDSAFAKQRTILLERFGSDAQILDAADAMHRAGYDAYAIGLIRGGLEKNPDSADLWVGLGNALTLYAGGFVTPAAELAFDRAAKLAPEHPGPAYFRGLAYLQAGQPERTVEIWTELIARAPTDAPWRPRIEQALGRLKMMLGQ